MTLLPAPMQCVAFALGALTPVIMIVWAKITKVRGAATRYLVGSLIAIAIFFAMALILPGARDPVDVFSGFLLLLAALLFWNVPWNLLAFGFTLTLLTALVKVGGPATRSQWISAYMQGADLERFARNRLQLLLRARMATIDGNDIVATPFGTVCANLVRLTRLLCGVR
ncbi:hypothetical protein JQ581_19150 [Bradyrhizobium liaoningense]|uniref:hypothetical protein n=1 Tax=Bradyrhizobium liaoningense TaxID=43992 RepID=UPI001BA6D3CB|nr:hypothetical protein [Bradyrhizobium liaoningense]MBR0739053.1 hypothetical protein [Bradyrhizobium liaoningense]